MISVLIPVHNYNICDLVKTLHKQLIAFKKDFEIICLDDNSNQQIKTSNLMINTLSNTSYSLSEKNNGIAITRQTLVEKAKYDWVILLDADVKLKDDLYIMNYLSTFKYKSEVVFGGITYEDEIPIQNSLLRWKYGVTCEALNASKRNERPYKITSAANMMIKKELYKRLCLDSVGASYGMDIFFGPQLKINKIPVLHISNEVYHLGLESSEKYLNKIKFGIETLLNLHDEKKIKIHENDLLKTFVFSKKTRLNYAFSMCFKLFENNLTRNLLGTNPSIKLLQLYKIAYMCNFDLKNGIK